MVMGVRRNVVMVAAVVAATAGALVQVAAPTVSRADEVVCPAGMYWDVIVLQCLYDVNVYLNPNPVVGPVGPVGVGGVVGPVGPGPVGPGPVGPGPVGPGRR